MNANLVKEALKVVLNPNVLVNMVSQRVRQLNSGGRGQNHSLVAETTNLGAADIALLEIIGEKMSFEMPEIIKLIRPSGKNGKRPQHWARVSSNGENVRATIR
jgi:DNA-directed RNA polymerase subunit omega